MKKKIRTTLAIAACAALTVPTVSSAQEPADVTLEQSKDCYILYSVVATFLESLGQKEDSYAALDTSLTWYRSILARVNGTTYEIDAEIKAESDELKAIVSKAMAGDADTRNAMQNRLTSLKGGCDALEKKFLS